MAGSPRCGPATSIIVRIRLLLQSDDADACLAGVLLHVFVERHGFEDDFLMNAAGIEQMQFAVPSPDCEAYMADVEAFLVGRDGDDVAVLDVTKHLFAVPYFFLWYVANGCS